MSNNNFPPLEPENALPEVLPEIPEQMEPLEDQPVIEELTFDQDDSLPEAPEEVTEEVPEETPALPEAAAEESVIEELSFPEVPLPEKVTSLPEETLPQEEPADFEAETTMVAEEVPLPPEPSEDPIIPVAPILPETPTDDWDTIMQGLPELCTEKNSSELPETAAVSTPAPEEEILDHEYRDDGQEFDTMMKATAPKAEPPKSAPQASTYKGRPKRKKGEGLLGIPSILVTFVWLALIVIIGVTAGRMLWICAADVLAFGREDKVVTVTVYEADTMEDIINKLHEGGLIRYKSLFSLYADISDAEEDIKPGIYDLNTRYDYHALVNFMSPRSSREVIKLTIPEGYTCRQIFALLEENRICTAVDAAAYAANGELSEYWFLEGLERGTENCLEGYLFPDTYEFYKNSTPKEAIERMLDNFEYRFNEEMIAQLDAINGKFGANYGVREIVIIASLIEKESAAPGESPKVSGVIYNRLFNWGGNRPLLNIDATIVYAQEGQNARIDTSLDHPYNTYLYEGLTPGPIANPGLSSLKAALNPESHNYYYYVLNPATGMHQFSTTYEEHQGYVREFNAAPEIEIE